MTRSSDQGESMEDLQRRRMAYRRVNWMLSNCGLVLTLSGVSPNSPEVQAIRRALRAVNVAGGIEEGRKEEGRVNVAGRSRFDQPPGSSAGFGKSAG